jgi:flavin reductase (DIM6/NTAB) family NADH-FMN oxidoreductase RutF
MTATATVDRTASESGVIGVLEAMPYGEYIVGSFDEAGVPNGMMADWVMQVAFAPRTMAVSFENDSHTLANIRANHFFSINLLPKDETGRQLYARFAQPYFDAKILGRRTPAAATGVHHKLEGIAHHFTSHGSPVLDEVIGWLECEADRFVDVGDHTLVTGRVVSGALVRQSEPLTSAYTGWSYAG